jgi:hypothetical protein
MRYALAMACVLLAGCGREPVYYALPPQHSPLAGEAPADFGEYVRMSDKRPEAYFVKHILKSEGTDWRWTLEEPELRFALRSTANRRFRMQWRLHPLTFKETGPVTLEFYVNGHLLHREQYKEPGMYFSEKPVPAEWLRAGESTLVRIKVLNPWQTSEPGVLYGFVLHEAGFVEP